MKQKVKLTRNTGSLVNYLMGNNSSVPEVGKGATLLHYTDRSAFEVVSVSPDGKRVTLQGCKAIRVDTNGMSDAQEYRYELGDSQFDVVWRNGAWRREIVEVWYTDAALELHWDVLKSLCIDPVTEKRKIVDGLTFIKKSYPKVNILFGVKQAYHDYSF